MKEITMQSGEYEYSFGEFILAENSLTDEEFEKALEIVNEIYDGVDELSHLGNKKFTLNKKYTINYIVIKGEIKYGKYYYYKRSL